MNAYKGSHLKIATRSWRAFEVPAEFPFNHFLFGLGIEIVVEEAVPQPPLRLAV
jgi:hypothetical protein